MKGHTVGPRSRRRCSGSSAGHAAARGKKKASSQLPRCASWQVPAATATGRRSGGRRWRRPSASPIKIMAVGDGGGDLTITDPHGDEKALTAVRRDGPPTSLSAEFTPTRAGATS